MLWYVRSKDKVIGPFPTGQIQQGLILGRITLEAEFSNDKEEWRSLHDYPQLIPEALKGDANDEHSRERLEAARRWADERRRERRSGDDPSRQGPGRRAPEGIATLAYRDHRETRVQNLRPGKERMGLVILAVATLLATGIYAGFRWIPQAPAGSQCDAPPAPGINWSQCNKAGSQLSNMDLSGAKLNSVNLTGVIMSGSKLLKADLSYADLRNSHLDGSNLEQAHLKGANLRSADLSHANLTRTDLSYADLQGANLTGANYGNADFSNAIWVDGKMCLVGSIGICRVSK